MKDAVAVVVAVEVVVVEVEAVVAILRITTTEQKKARMTAAVVTHQNIVTNVEPKITGLMNARSKASAKSVARLDIRQVCAGSRPQL